jgi:hypothetical protein
MMKKVCLSQLISHQTISHSMTIALEVSKLARFPTPCLGTHAFTLPCIHLLGPTHPLGLSLNIPIPSRLF